MFWLTDLSYTFPFVGKLRRFSHDYAKSHNGWLNVENTLCRDYAKHIACLSQDDFNNHSEYLRKTYDHGRKPMPMWVLAVLTVLIVAEGLGFSYLLGSFMSLEGSENVRTILMIGIVTVLAVVLLWVTHAAGHQLYRTNLLRDIFKRHQVDGVKSFSTRVVKLNELQSIDDHEPAHIQCANRITTRPGDRGSLSWLWIALAFIMIVAVGSTILRIETLNSIEAEEAAPAASIFAEADEGAAAPTPVGAQDAGAEARHNAAIAGFALLGVIFLVTQFVGMRVGYMYGFVGLQSADAYKATGGSADYATYWSSMQHRIDVANLRLNKLHQLLEAGAPGPLDFQKTFLDFIREERGRGSRHLHEPPQGMSAPAEPTPTPSPPGGGGRGRPTLVTGSSEQVERAADAFERAPTETAKLEILDQLDAEAQDAVMIRLEARRAERHDDLRKRFAGHL
jgi:hypothetical protein